MVASPERQRGGGGVSSSRAHSLQMHRSMGPTFIQLAVSSALLSCSPGIAERVFSSEDYPNCDGDGTLIADGVCDSLVNNADCGYDGGDCCQCTCVDGPDNACGEVGDGYVCLDPDVPQNCGPTASPTPTSTVSLSTLIYSSCAGYTPFIADGYCDEINNNAACGYDGGDCCACTCVDGLDYICGKLGFGFNCQDPDAPVECSSDFDACSGNELTRQNGICDSENNNAECGYDGGDCCECTCRVYSSFLVPYLVFCGPVFDCQDPAAPTDCETEQNSSTSSPEGNSSYPDCNGYVPYISDGDCDISNNNAECAWDGGDCCSCTCGDADFSCGENGYFCRDPDSGCVTSSGTSSYETWEDDSSFGEDDSSFVSSSYFSSGSETAIIDGLCSGTTNLADGYCNSNFNTPLCLYDGGDCCECTCVSTSYYTCGYNGYECLDPAIDCTVTPSPIQRQRDPDIADVASVVGSSKPVSKRQVLVTFVVSAVAYFCFAGLVAGILALIAKRCRSLARNPLPTVETIIAQPTAA